jgi:hypothetical protein
MSFSREAVEARLRKYVDYSLEIEKEVVREVTQCRASSLPSTPMQRRQPAYVNTAGATTKNRS